jgi:hypothetical protein
MNVQIEFNDNEVQRLLERAPDAYHRALLAAAEDTVTDVHLQMQTYPPKRAGSSYERRNNLRASWLKRVLDRGGTVIGEVVSSGQVAPYNVWVQKHELQAWMHRGYWTNTDRNVVQRTRQRVDRYYRAALDRAIAQLR